MLKSSQMWKNHGRSSSFVCYVESYDMATDNYLATLECWIMEREAC